MALGKDYRFAQLVASIDLDAIFHQLAEHGVNRALVDNLATELNNRAGKILAQRIVSAIAR